MNNTERFDEWVRGEMNNLDSPPENFQSNAVWQKLQTELHPAPEKKLSFIRRVFVTPEASKYRVAAVIALLFLMGGIWWKIESTPAHLTVSQVVGKPKNSSVLQGNQTLLAATNDVLKEKVTLKKQVSPKKQSKEKLPEINLAQIVNPAESKKNVSSYKNVGKVWNLADVTNTPEQIAENISTERPDPVNIVPIIENPTNQLTVKATPKPKFKIVHANELADYQKAELAEVREKEAKAKGFVVINWKANSPNQSESSLMSYFKNKSSKAD